MRSRCDWFPACSECDAPGRMCISLNTDATADVAGHCAGGPLDRRGPGHCAGRQRDPSRPRPRRLPLSRRPPNSQLAQVGSQPHQATVEAATTAAPTIQPASTKPWSRRLSLPPALRLHPGVRREPCALGHLYANRQRPGSGRAILPLPPRQPLAWRWLRLPRPSPLRPVAQRGLCLPRRSLQRPVAQLWVRLPPPSPLRRVAQ